MTKDFYQAVEDRYSTYLISDQKIVPEDRIEEVVQFAVKHTPHAFNSQSGRVVVLFGEHHEKLWEITKAELKKVTPEQNFPNTEAKINGFKAGYGTVLFFEDQKVVQGLQEQFDLYKDNFPVWSEQASGMLQYVIWTALENEGLGASLQHYNPLIDKEVQKQWDIPEHWLLRGQMPFGKPEGERAEKEYQPIEERVKFFK
ncbi:nitroreductase family protein [Amphibacillus sp. Q70]|uniref:nitroreductase family protein n=1 Tax=Amphibacillus sp. Q70 TaxID=3453416 RepID=UPI003F84C970